MSKQVIGAKEQALREMREARSNARPAKDLSEVKAAVAAIPVARRPKTKKKDRRNGKV